MNNQRSIISPVQRLVKNLIRDIPIGGLFIVTTDNKILVTTDNKIGTVRK